MTDNKTLSVSTINIYGVPVNNISKRHYIVAESLLDQKSGIICIQELASRYSKDIIINKLKSEYIYNIFSYQYCKYNLISMFPSIYLSLCAIYVDSLILSMISIIFMPNVMLFILNLISKQDYFAQTTLVNKKICDYLEPIKQVSFLDIYSFKKILEYWFCNSFLHPGFSISRCVKNNKTSFIIVNCHLIPCESSYIIRMSQVQRIIEAVGIEMKKHECDKLIWCGDFNADPSEPCINLIRNDLSYMIHGIDDELITCSSSNNSMAVNGKPCEKRIDYIISSSNIICENIKLFCDGKNYPIVSDHFGVVSNFLVFS